MKTNDKQNLQKQRKKRVLISSIGQCVHVAGAYNFMNIATRLNFKCKFLGPAIKINTIIKEIKKFKPEIVGLSYRLTPSTVKPLLDDFNSKFNELESKPKMMLFAGTPRVIKFAKEYDIFDHYFIGGESKFQILSTLKGEKQDMIKRSNIPMDLIGRIEWKKPYPIIRAHFGLSEFNETIKGIRKIAKAEILDVISIAPDQNTQANYFHPEKQRKDHSGAGGVPLRSEEDFEELHRARLIGNKPLLRIYAGTRDFIQLAELYQRTFKNAWAAIPIFWFNQMDGRGPLNLKESIKQHLDTIKWHANKNIPVEINDPHHWSLRDAPDAIAVADMYLCGIIAKKLGVKHFVAQYMFNTPSASSLEMDLAKMLAKDELLSTLTNKNFKVIKQVRTGLASFPLNHSKAKGQLALSLAIQLAIRPDIVHVVSYSEATHAARPEDVIESCEIAEQVINRVYSSNINYIDERVLKRKNKLIKQAKWIVDIVPSLAKNQVEQTNPWINYRVLNRLVKYGIFDAPHLKNNSFAQGKIKTKIIDGGCYSWDINEDRKLDERKRIQEIMHKLSSKFPKLTKANNKIRDVIIEE
ncbi:MAG: methionine synthase [Candidatus Lokiarchaeota archaeon]|nr:methionine synthase [Candidatus Lokiarchaeota archaeon]